MPTTVAMIADAHEASSKLPMTKIPSAMTSKPVTQPQPFSSCGPRAGLSGAEALDSTAGESLMLDHLGS
jgi:hypothetical protein